MTKKYDITHLNNKMYVIEKNPVFRMEDYYIDDTFTIRKVVVDEPEYWARRSDYAKIIASSDPSLGLPLVPPIEDDESKLAHDDFKHMGYKSGETDFVVGFVRGYRATTTKKYTEEDMEKAFEAGRNYGFVECGEGFGVMWEGKSENKPKPFEKWAPFFKLPKQVEVDMVYHFGGAVDCGDPDLDDYDYYTLRLTKDNYISVKRWIYG